MRAVVSRSPRRRLRSTTNAASTTTMRIFPSSEAWKEKKGSWMARREPRAIEPRAMTATSDVSMRA